MGAGSVGGRPTDGPPADAVLGLDVGTSGVRAVLVAPAGDAPGEVLASASAPLALGTPRPGWAEQDPEAWWAASLAAVRGALARAPGVRVAAAGVSGQMHSSVFLDRAGAVVRPALLWCDGRTTAECAEITERAGGEAGLRAMVRNAALEGFTLPKVLWLRAHEPAAYARLATVLLAKDYVRYRLTGALATEPSDASGTLMFDPAAGRWSAELLGAVGVPASLLPAVGGSAEVLGRVTPAAAAATGLPFGTPVVGGGADNACGAAGVGVVAPGGAVASWGTSGTVLATTAEPVVDPGLRAHTFCHVAPGVWYVMGVVLSAGGAFAWYRDQFARELAGVPDADARLDAEAASVPPGAEGVTFLPYLQGERTPHRDASLRGSFRGLSLAHGRAHLTRAVLEGVAFAMRDSVELLRGLGLARAELLLTGGGARSAFLRQLQADVYGAPVSTVDREEGPAYGAALLAAVGAGAYPDLAAAARATLTRSAPVAPDAERHRAYDAPYARFRAAVACVALACAGLAGAALAVAPRAARAQPSAAPAYRDSTRPVEARVRDLLGRMTLEEKVAQLRSVKAQGGAITGPDARFSADSAARHIALGIGRIERPSEGPREGRTPAEHARYVNDAQRFLVERTRLGVPALTHEEALHGFVARDATSFPQAIALASSWDPALVERVFAAAAAEARARGTHQVLAPVVDVARDPRWGRTEETYGEDPYLAGRIGAAAVRGLQGPRAPGADTPVGAGHVIATLKHMAGHGQPESGENTAPAPFGERTLREVFLPPFEAAVREAGAMSVMPSYNEFDGVPMHANVHVLREILRGEWGFRGTVVSDWGALGDLVTLHHVAADSAAAAGQAIRAGVDAELPDLGGYGALAALVRAGRVPGALVDSAAARTLRHKFLLGLFEHPYVDTALAVRSVGDPARRALALEAARRSIVLLKNDSLRPRAGAAVGAAAAPVLPLDRGRVRTIAVVGPNAAETFLGGYSETPLRSVNVLDGVRRAAGPSVRVRYAEGVRVTEPVRDPVYPARGGTNAPGRWHADIVRLADPSANAPRIAAAAALARQSDVAVVVVGDNEQTSREAWSPTHLGDRTSLDLVGDQNALVRAVVATGTPTVVVLVHGRPLSIADVAARAPAIVDAWYPGQEGGTAVAEVLFGDVNPGGKLPVSVARSVGHLPVFYNRKQSARRGYLFDRTDALFPFGHGLSYTTFRVGAPRVAGAAVSAERLAAGDSVPVRVEVTNTGRRAGDEVVQLYLRDVVSSATRPVMELRGFERVALRPGETREVTFRLPPAAFAFWDAQMRHVVEPGDFEIMAGGSSAAVRTARLAVTGDRARELPR